MRQGTRVRVKSWHNIKDTLQGTLFNEEAGVLKGNKRMNFAAEMKRYCGYETRVLEAHTNDDGDTVYRLDDCQGWWWHELWLYDLSYKQNNLPEELFTL